MSAKAIHAKTVDFVLIVEMATFVAVKKDSLDSIARTRVASPQ